MTVALVFVLNRPPINLPRYNFKMYPLAKCDLNRKKSTNLILKISSLSPVEVF